MKIRLLKTQSDNKLCKRSQNRITFLALVGFILGTLELICTGHSIYVSFVAGLLLSLSVYFGFKVDFGVFKSTIDRGASQRYREFILELTPKLVVIYTLGLFSCFLTISGLSLTTLENAAIGFAVALIAGPLLAIAELYNHEQKLRKLKPSRTERLLNFHQVQDFVIHMKLDNAFDYCLSKIELASKYKVLKENRELGVISIRAGIYFGSKDSYVTLFLSKLSDDATSVIVTSRPSFSMFVADGGGNIVIVRELVELLSSELKVLGVEDNSNS